MSKKINHVDVTLLPQFNLSLIQAYAKKSPILSPSDWIRSEECADILERLTGQRYSHHFTLYQNLDSNHYYTHGFWVYMGYLCHCVGDSLAAAILAELNSVRGA